MGLGEIILMVVFVAATWASIAKRSLAVSTAFIGALMLVWFAVSVAFGESHPILAMPYDVINIYVFLFVAALLTLAGCIGLLVHFVHRLGHGTQS
jgi:hypothetical protein